MRILISAILAAASALTTGLSVATLSYYRDKTGELEPLVIYTWVLWGLFALSLWSLLGSRKPGGARRLSTRTAVVLVLAGSVAIGGAALLGPPNTSTDSARYAWDGIVQKEGISPYDYVPADPALANLRPDWLFPTPVVKANGDLGCTGDRIMRFLEPGTNDVICTTINRATAPTIYPPTSEIYYAAVRLFVGSDVEYKPMQVAGLLLSLGITVILLRALITRGRDPRWAAVWGWSPLAATEGVTNSHVDLVAAILLLAASLFVSSGKRWGGGLALGASIAAKLIPVIGAPALLGRRPWPIIAGSVTAFALLYVPYLLASGVGVLGFLPTYFGEEGYGSGRRFVLLSLIAPGAASTVLAVLLIGVTGAMVWWKSTPANPWVGQVVMIGTTLLILTPRYAWYALLLVPMIAMAGRWEWLAVPLALTVRLLIGDPTVGRVAIAVAIVFIIVVSLKRAGPGVLGRIGALPAEAWHDFRSLRIGRASQHPPATGVH